MDVGVKAPDNASRSFGCRPAALKIHVRALGSGQYRDWCVLLPLVRIVLPVSPVVVSRAIAGPRLFTKINLG